MRGAAGAVSSHGRAPTGVEGNAAGSRGERPWRERQEGLHPLGMGSPSMKAGDYRGDPGRGGVTRSGEHRPSWINIQDKAAGAEAPREVAGVTEDPDTCCTLWKPDVFCLAVPRWPHLPSLGTVRCSGPGTLRNKAACRGRARLWKPRNHKSQVTFGTLSLCSK